MTHNEAMDYITQHLLEQPLESEILARSKRHIANCRHCINELDILLKIIGAGIGENFLLKEKSANFLTCEECIKQLPEYIELSEKEKNEIYPLMRIHLNSCHSCQTEFTILNEMFLQEEKGVYGKVPIGPSFKEVVRPFQIWIETNLQLRRFFTKIQILVAKGKTFFKTPLLQTYQYAPAISFRGEKETSDSKQIEMLDIQDDKRNCKIRLELSTDLDGVPNLGLELRDASNKPLRNIRYLLCDESGYPYEGEQGIEEPAPAKFKLKKGNSIIKVKYKDNWWEIPIEIKYKEVINA